MIVYMDRQIYKNYQFAILGPMNHYFSMMQFDMHVHTTVSSCSRLELSDILHNAVQIGLNGVCITDHNTCRAKTELQEGLQPDGLIVLVGMEYETPEGDFLLFGSDLEIPPGLDATVLLRRIREKQGVAIAAHPFRANRPVAEHLIRSGRCSAVESVNGRNLDIENQRVQAWRRKYGIAEVGGSDAHSLAELGKIRTAFSVPIHSMEDLVTAVQNGQCLPVLDSAEYAWSMA